ncbi:MAG: 50S ribosomal protein L30 [Chloroflexota bacterium]
MAAKKKTGKQIEITLVKSPIGYPQRQKGTVKALGLNKINQTRIHFDTPVLRGMIAKVSHLVKVQES